MTRKHFKALAAALLSSRPPTDDPQSPRDLEHFELQSLQWRADVRAVANVCSLDNPNFDYGVFYTACNYTHTYA